MAKRTDLEPRHLLHLHLAPVGGAESMVYGTLSARALTAANMRCRAMRRRPGGDAAV